ncbi:hypothetical protein RE628_04430 [Paenibacillus sp. D2_2]|uniref:ABC-three component system protein n=1 Tax=Paenibacillus sp. D2_2 TaxID=3073092 RepID=UPI002815E203|nr:ABC-three component system protein [Paenibacillus sp. D2_2]WMT41742.1 hypothetical protein RE628_04430 [Paenibacillus sp. D2_2]
MKKDADCIVTIDSQDTHSAVPSWSGYDFQGQVAIYTSLCFLNSLDLTTADIYQYFLEIEHLEDFSIKQNASYLSIHQVKSYQTTYHFSSYKEAVLELMGKCAKYDGIVRGNLHTTCLIEEPTREALFNLLKDYNPTTKIEKLNGYKKLLFEHQKFDEVFDKLTYNKGIDLPYDLVVNIDEIGDKIKEQLAIFYSRNSHLFDQESLTLISSSENINYIYHNLQAELDDWIIRNHKGVLEEPMIAFNVFFEILITKNIFQFSNKTAAGLLKDSLKKCFAEYCEDHDITLETNPECANWENSWKYIRQLNDDEFILLCKKISPNIVIKSDTITLLEYRELLNSRGVKDALIHLTLEIGKLSLELTDVKNVFVLNKLGSHHLISTISDSKAPRAVGNVSKRIIKNLKHNNQLSHLLFDIHKIITTDLEGTFEGEIFDVQATYQKEQGKSIEVKNSVTVPKNWSLLV